MIKKFGKAVDRVIMSKRIIFLIICIFIITSSVGAENISNVSEWEKYFKKAKTQGTFVLYNLGSNQWKIFNKKRAETRYIPASTFKIAHTLIALETKVIKDSKEVFPWDGVLYNIKTWNREHTLKTAMKYSVVPIYQSFARVIGPEKMKDFLIKFNYGNKDLSGKIDSFWLDGPLAISAIEQINFLVKLYKDILPVSRENQWIVKDILVNEATKDYVLRAKTGMTSKLGWYVGWVETDDNTYFFACNLDLTNDKSAVDRVNISKQILKVEKILP